jgi:hypothetical protein
MEASTAHITRPEKMVKVISCLFLNRHADRLRRHTTTTAAAAILTSRIAEYDAMVVVDSPTVMTIM